MRCRQRQRIREDVSPPSSKTKLRKGHWSPEEDEKLIAYLIGNGMLGCSWTRVAKQSGLQRCGKSCRLRWINYLRPGIKRGAFSPEEEQLVINLQSILGNSRWSQIAAQMPGRTDNEIKNYWNASIKKKLRFKQYHISSGSAQPYMDAARLEGYRRTNNAVDVVMATGESQFCVPGILELKREQVQGQNVVTNKPISNLPMWINDTFTHTHENVSSHAAFPGSAGITIPAVVERECLKDKIENNGWSTTHSYSNTDDLSRVLHAGAYSGNETGIIRVEDYESLCGETTLQSCTPLSFHSQFGAPAIQWPVGQSDDFQAEDDCRDRINLRYDANFGVQTYSRQKSYQLPQIDAGGGVGDQRDCSIIPHEETNATPIPNVLGRSGPFEIQCKSGDGQFKVWEHDDMYNILNTASVSVLDQKLF